MAREVPPHVSALLNRLCGAAQSFNELYEENIQRMRDIACELREISDRVEELQNKTLWTNWGGKAIQAAGCGVGLLTGLVVGAQKATVQVGAAIILGGLTASIIGGAAASKANLEKSLTERDELQRVNELDNEFANITGRLKDFLVEIHRVSDELKQRSPVFRITAGEQARSAVAEIEEFQLFLKRMSELKEDEKVKVIFTQSAKQCEKTIEELDKIKSMLTEFDQN